MKNHNLRRPKGIALSDQQRAFLVREICAIIDNLLDLLIEVDPAPTYLAPFIGWELPAARRPLRRDGLTDDNFDVSRRLAGLPPSPPDLGEAGVQSRWAYPLCAVWDKHIRTNLN